MIFLTVGIHFQGLKLLSKTIDEISPRILNVIMIQKGCSKCVPRNSKYFDFGTMRIAMEYIQKSDLVVFDAGIGIIIFSREYGISDLIFPVKSLTSIVRGSAKILQKDCREGYDER